MNRDAEKVINVKMGGGGGGGGMCHRNLLATSFIKFHFGYELVSLSIHCSHDNAIVGECFFNVWVKSVGNCCFPAKIIDSFQSDLILASCVPHQISTKSDENKRVFSFYLI